MARAPVLLCIVVFVAATAATVASTMAQPMLERLTIVAPAAPGGGWDQTARAMQRALEADGLVRSVQVENVPGAAGTIGLARFVNDTRRTEPALLVTGLVMIGALAFTGSTQTLGETAPVAALTGEFEVIVVHAASPLRNTRDLIDRFRRDPASVSWGGGSAGGTDHILAGLIASATGVDPAAVNYVAFSGGGEVLAAVLGGQVTAAISGYSEFAPHIASGRLRALAVSAPSRQPGVDAPPLSEAGLAIALANWRGVVAPRHLGDGAKAQLVEVVTRMARGPTWQRTLRERGWSDQFLPAGEFHRFIESEQARVAGVAASLRGSGSAGLAARLFPVLVIAGALLLAGALAVSHVRGGTPVAGRADIRALSLVVLALLAYLAALASAGFIVASALLFWIVAIAFDGRHRRRDLAIAVMFSIAVYVVFTRGLNLPLPAGWADVRGGFGVD